uniref:Uncharacterized protein n=1 Tax=Trichuris muris TaxID=70415 RepID=A0A5S6QAR7_TRIMR
MNENTYLRQFDGDRSAAGLKKEEINGMTCRKMWTCHKRRLPLEIVAHSPAAIWQWSLPTSAGGRKGGMEEMYPTERSAVVGRPMVDSDGRHPTILVFRARQRDPWNKNNIVCLLLNLLDNDDWTEISEQILSVFKFGSFELAPMANRTNGTSIADSSLPIILWQMYLRMQKA